jgi:uncharacterized cupredoxin-like copper-binding protein
MRIRINGPAGAVMSAAIAGVLLAGCGSSDNATTTNQTATGTEAAGGAARKAVEIKMGDYFFAPKSATAKAGQTTIEAPNNGSVEHELVLFKTNMSPANLPTEASGGVDEEKLDKEAEEAGEIADVEAGETKSEEFDLSPGKYVMFCNLPGHYAQGMYGTITVTK